MKIKNLILAVAFIPTFTFANAITSDIGRGLSHFEKELNVKDRCIQTLYSHNIHKEDIRSTNFSMTLVKNKEELYETLTTSFSSSAKFIKFSAGAKHSFVKDVKWNHNSNYVLIKATRISYKESLNQDKLLLSESSKRLLLRSKHSFLEACGTSFSNAIYYGGEIYGVIEIISSTFDEKKKIESKIESSGSFSIGKASGKANFIRNIREITSNFQSKVSFRHIGGNEIRIPTEIEDLIELSSKIEEITDKNPVAIEHDSRDYTTLANYEHDDVNHETFKRQELITMAQRNLDQARTMYANINLILTFPDKFNQFDKDYLFEQLRYFDNKILHLKDFIYTSYNLLNDVDQEDISIDLNVNLPKKRTTRSFPGGRREVQIPVKCEIKESPLCGVESYKVASSPACNVIGANTGTGPVCGQKIEIKASEFCGVKQYLLKEAQICGVALYKACHTKKCGKNWDGSRKRCRHSRCGVEKYNSCRHASFGVEEYNTCADPRHSPLDFLTCSDKSFGLKFESCQHLSHGPEKFKSCSITRIGNTDTFCPSIK